MQRNVQSTLNDLTSIWRNWATYGLGVGKAALTTSAKTLETTAARLNDWSAQIEVSKAKAEAPAVKAEAMDETETAE